MVRKDFFGGEGAKITRKKDMEASGNVCHGFFTGHGDR